MQTANVNIPIQVTGRHIDITEAMSDYARQKVEQIHLDYPRITEVQFILDVEKHRHSAEMILICNNHITIEASHECDDMYAAIDGVLSKVTRQMRKYKTKILRNHRPRGNDIRHLEEQVLHLDESFETHEDSEPTVVETQRYPVKPMFVDEAVLQIEMSARQFVVFQNAKSEKVNILYRRKDGGFGLIEPVFA
ncbi:MAG: ribosome-associated translation inhibitor RaiA [Chthoniobacteraceae bacterium]